MSKKQKSAYLLAGSEEFIKRENLAKIKASSLEEQSAEFNCNVFYAGSSAVEKILECAQTLPFYGPKRVVVVYAIENFSANEKGHLLSYLKTHAPQFSCLILETRQSNLSHGFLAQVAKFVQVVYCNPITADQLFLWINNQVKAQGKTIDKKAILVLLDNLGDNLQLLANCLNNLILYIGNREVIELADVERLVGRDLNSSVFSLFNAVIARKADQAFQILDSLFKDNIHSGQILGALTHQLVSGRNRLNSNQIENSLLQLQKTDADIKTGRQVQRFALELLLARLLQLV